MAQTRKPSAAIIAAMLAALAAIGVAAFVTWLQLDRAGNDERLGGEAAIAPGLELGGPFELTNGDGETVTAADFRGKHMLVFFGYTYCPDVCPTELATAGAALDMMPEDMATDVAPIFITIDPERDTPEVVGQYVEHFHPNMIGLTGSPESIDRVAKAYRVYYAKSGVTEDDDAYLMDHSSYLYLMGPDGSLRSIIQPRTTPEQLAAILERHAGQDVGGADKVADGG